MCNYVHYAIMCTYIFYIKVWKKTKYNSIGNRCLIIDIYIDIFVDDIQSLYIYNP